MQNDQILNQKKEASESGVEKIDLRFFPGWVSEKVLLRFLHARHNLTCFSKITSKKNVDQELWSKREVGSFR